VATIDMGRKDGGSVPVSRRAGPRLIQCGLGRGHFRTKWRLHPSSRLATINMGQKLGGGGCALCSGGSWVPIEHKVAWAEAYLHTKWHLSPSRNQYLHSPAHRQVAGMAVKADTHYPYIRPVRTGVEKCTRTYRNLLR